MGVPQRWKPVGVGFWEFFSKTRGNCGCGKLFEPSARQTGRRRLASVPAGNTAPRRSGVRVRRSFRLRKRLHWGERRKMHQSIGLVARRVDVLGTVLAPTNLAPTKNHGINPSGVNVMIAGECHWAVHRPKQGSRLLFRHTFLFGLLFGGFFLGGFLFGGLLLFGFLLAF